MGVIISFILFIFVLIWAFRLEIGVAKANESLARIEEQLKKGKK